MSGSLNRVMLIGRLTRDPELRFTPSGTAVCNLALATNRYGQDASGERREFTDYHDIVVWNQGNRKLAELCGQYLQKGRMVYIEGRLQTRSWDDKQSGQKKYMTEVVANDLVLLGARGEGGVSEYSGSSRGASASSSGNNFDQSAPEVEHAPAGGSPITDEDIPF